MRTLATLATTTLLLLFMATAPAYPQDDAKPENKAAQQDDKNKQDKDKEKDKAAKPDEAKPGQEQPAVRPDERKPEERKNDDRKDDRKNDERQNQAPNENRQPAASQPQQRPAQEMNRGHEQHQAQRGKRIPDDKFRASFGHQHTFHVQRTQVVNTSQPVVVFGGYSFELVEAWPVDWGFDDDVYVDYVDDGYYLFDVLHPGIRIAVFVVE
jgi:DNA mismatch repair ATPase MutL